MEVIGAFDAKTRLSELLARAEHGESFVITKHGRPVARIVPDQVADLERVSAAASRLRSLRGTLKDTSLEQICEDRRNGHRF
ncbi:MAG: type II toxin-antitoxin system prevent-host-death family antitoxin [Deltaproteobacteria bacterium]|nr:type II toxin-antitoxin system prevent-host-death family antitoxin [Deltaproteobacteria bacterium]